VLSGVNRPKENAHFEVRHNGFIYRMKRKTNLPARQNRSEIAEALDALNRSPRKAGVRRLVEATIEKQAKKRRSREAPASSAWQSG
jgi:hypothetical protein